MKRILLAIVVGTILSYASSIRTPLAGRLLRGANIKIYGAGGLQIERVKVDIGLNYTQVFRTVPQGSLMMPPDLEMVSTEEEYRSVVGNAIDVGRKGSEGLAAQSLHGWPFYCFSVQWYFHRYPRLDYRSEGAFFSVRGADGVNGEYKGFAFPYDIMISRFLANSIAWISFAYVVMSLAWLVRRVWLRRSGRCDCGYPVASGASCCPECGRKYRSALV